LLKLTGFDLAESFPQRALGIMFRLKLKRPLLFVFPRKAKVENAIHSLFVFIEFDAVFLDEKKKVVDVRERITPFTPIIVPRKPAKYLVEAPAGWIKKKKVRLGGRIDF
jgi:uncharacterized membrane protein (UPF0127 family)